AQLGESDVEVTLFQRGPALQDVQARRLRAVVGGHELASLLQRRRGFVLSAGTGERQAELVAGLAVVRGKTRRLLELLDRLGDLAVPQVGLAEGDAGPGERGLELDDLLELLDPLGGAGGGARPVGGGEVEPGLHGARREGAGLLELLYGLFRIARYERRAEVGVRVRIVLVEAHRLAELRDPAGIV